MRIANRRNVKVAFLDWNFILLFILDLVAYRQAMQDVYNEVYFLLKNV